MEHLSEQVHQCPACGNESKRHFLTCNDHTVSHTPFHIVECTSCGMRFTDPRPTEHTIGPYYASAEYVSHNDTSEGLLFQIYQKVKRFTLRSKAGLVSRYSNGKVMLDYGAGTGDFAGNLLPSGIQVMAFEPDASARDRISHKYPDIDLREDLSTVKDASVAVVTLWHVLEHVHRLEVTLDHFNRMLEKDGTLIIAVPNCASFDAQHYGAHWAAYDVPRHLYHFRHSDIKSILQRHGFVLQTIRPMWFDSYYVSLLSEGYQNNTNRHIRKLLNWSSAVVIGSISNLMALTDTKRCSSIIYILKKG